MPPPKVSRGFSFFGGGGSSGGDDTARKFGGRDDGKKKNVRLEDLASLKLQTDKDVYRPGDPVLVTIEIRNNSRTEDARVNEESSLLIENMTFEMKGIEKLDTQWFATQKPSPDSKQKRGEYIFLECSTMTVISNKVISYGGTRKYLVRTSLPSIIPPSFRGSTIRYTYYIRSILSGQHMTFENDHSGRRFINALSQLEARVPLQVWLSQKSNGLPIEEGWTDGIVPPSTIFLDAYWKEMDGESDWARLSETNDEVEEGYDSSRDEISSVSSYNPNKNNITKAFGSSLSLQSSTSRSSMKERNSLSNNMSPPQLAVSEVLYDSGAADFPPSAKSSTFSSPIQRPTSRKSVSTEDSRLLSDPGAAESVASEGFLRGRSYNFRLDDQVLLRFSPKNPDSSYYLSDMIGGTLTFFHEKGLRRCLELSVTLQMTETINRRSVHPSRKHSPTITKVQSDHHEVVADLVQTSFLFSIPMDGPMSFSTPHVSIQWALCFEFYTTPKNVDWTRYEHPLLIDGRDKCEWVLPITVHAPPGAPTFQLRNEKTAFPSESLWVRT